VTFSSVIGQISEWILEIQFRSQYFLYFWWGCWASSDIRSRDVKKKQDRSEISIYFYCCRAASVQKFIKTACSS